MGIIITFRGLTWCFSSSSSSELEDGQDIQTNWKRDFRELFYSFHRHYHRYHHRNMSRIDIIIIFWTRGWTGNPNKLATGFLRQRALSAWTSEARTRERFFKLFWSVFIIIIIISTLPLILNIYCLGWLVKRPWSGRRRRMPARLTSHLVFILTVIIVIIISIVVNVIIINFSPSLLGNVEAF